MLNIKSYTLVAIVAVVSFYLGSITNDTIAYPKPTEHNDAMQLPKAYSDARNYSLKESSLRTHLGVVQDGKNTYAIYYLTTYNGSYEKDPQYVYVKELIK
jgi:hypothetical protein